MIFTIPQKFIPLFWEYQGESLDLNKHNRLIIERILEKGDMEAVIWLFKEHSQNQIKNILLSSANISSITRLFWSKYFEYGKN